MTEYFDLWKLIAGLGLFLFGMSLLEQSLKKLVGKRFRRMLQHSTNKPFRSVFGGVVATSILQSSSLVGLLVLAFVGAGIIPLVNAIGIIIGSNLGTTFTGWIVTTLGFKVNFSSFIYPLIGFGGLAYGLTKGKIRFISQLLLGFAFLLMGLDFMKAAVGELNQLIDIKSIAGYPLIVYLIAGAVFTAVIQSSSAAMMLTLSALYAGIIPLPAAAAIVIGADLGTTSTVFLGSLQGQASKRRLAMAHVIFNFSVDTVAFILLYPLIELIKWFALTDPLYSLVAFHSLFNLIGLILFLPFISQFAAKLEAWFPENQSLVNQYLHDVPVSIRDAAIEALTKESKQLLGLVVHSNLRFLDAKQNHLTRLKELFSFADKAIVGSRLEEYLVIKGLEGEIINYALKISIAEEGSTKTQQEADAHRIDNLISVARNGVYAAKAFKDIEQDLESFHVIDNDYFSGYFEQLKSTAIKVNCSLIEQLESTDDNSIKEKRLNQINQELEEEQQALLQRIYNNRTKVNLTTTELSTLLNVKKEITTSAEALISAIKLV